MQNFKGLPFMVAEVSVEDDPAWEAVITVPQGEEWLVVGYLALENVTAPKYTSVFKRMNLEIETDYGIINDTLIITKSSVAMEAPLSGRGWGGGSFSVAFEGMEVSGGKKITLSQVSGESLDDLITLKVFYLKRAKVA